MSTQRIPERILKHCDCCGVECTPNNSVREGHLTLKQHAVDYQGSPCANATVTLDLCDRCLNVIGKAINKAAEEIKQEPKP